MEGLEKFLSRNRKFKLTLLYFVVVTVMLIIGKVNENTYLDFLLYSLGIFSGANALQKLRGIGKHVHYCNQNSSHNQGGDSL